MASIDRLQGVRTSKAIKAPVAAATTANVVLSGEQTIDGIALVADDRVLVKDQTDATENGIYVVANGAWARSRDFNRDNDIAEGTAVIVNAGTTHSDTQFVQDTASPVIGVSNLTFAAQAANTSSFGAQIVSAADAAAVLDLLGNPINNLVEDTTPQLGGTLDANSRAIFMSKGADVASASDLLVLTDGNVFDVTGSVTIATIENTANDFPVGSSITLQFDSGLTMTHSANLLLPGDADLVVVAGNIVTLLKRSATSWRLISFNGVPTTTAPGLVRKSSSGQNIAGTATTAHPDVAGVKEMINTFAHGFKFVEDTYDFGVDGTVASVESAAFEDGYEYGFVLWGLDHNAGVNAFFQVEQYLETGAAYHAQPRQITDAHNSPEGFGFVDFLFSRTATDYKFGRTDTFDTSNITIGTDDGESAVGKSRTLIWSLATAQKIGKVRFSSSTGSLNGGKIIMLRRSV